MILLTNLDEQKSQHVFVCYYFIYNNKLNIIFIGYSWSILYDHFSKRKFYTAGDYALYNIKAISKKFHTKLYTSNDSVKCLGGLCRLLLSKWGPFNANNKSQIASNIPSKIVCYTWCLTTLWQSNISRIVKLANWQV